jgi:hypothetical protein
VLVVDHYQVLQDKVVSELIRDDTGKLTLVGCEVTCLNALCIVKNGIISEDDRTITVDRVSNVVEELVCLWSSTLVALNSIASCIYS